MPAELAVEGGSVVGGGTAVGGTWALMPAWTLFSMVLPSWTMLADTPACTAFTISVVRPVIPVPPAPVVVVVVVVVLAEVAVEAVEVILPILFLIVFLCQSSSPALSCSHYTAIHLTLEPRVATPLAPPFIPFRVMCSRNVYTSSKMQLI